MAKILVVDDDRELVGSVVATLEGHGYSVVTAFSGEDGYEQARAEKPDLMLLDVMMTHDTEGFDIVKRLREDQNTKDLPVILVTGIRKAKSLPFGFEPDEDWLPVKAVLEKPVASEDLLKHVRSALS